MTAPGQGLADLALLDYRTPSYPMFSHAPAVLGGAASTNNPPSKVLGNSMLLEPGSRTILEEGDGGEEDAKAELEAALAAMPEDLLDQEPTLGFSQTFDGWDYATAAAHASTFAPSDYQAGHHRNTQSQYWEGSFAPGEPLLPQQYITNLAGTNNPPPFVASTRHPPPTQAQPQPAPQYHSQQQYYPAHVVGDTNAGVQGAISTIPPPTNTIPLSHPLEWQRQCAEMQQQLKEERELAAMLAKDLQDTVAELQEERARAGTAGSSVHQLQHERAIAVAEKHAAEAALAQIRSEVDALMQSVGEMFGVTASTSSSTICTTSPSHHAAALDLSSTSSHRSELINGGDGAAGGGAAALAGSRRAQITSATIAEIKRNLTETVSRAVIAEQRNRSLEEQLTRMINERRELQSNEGVELEQLKTLLATSEERQFTLTRKVTETNALLDIERRAANALQLQLEQYKDAARQHDATPPKKCGQCAVLEKRVEELRGTLAALTKAQEQQKQLDATQAALQRDVQAQQSLQHADDQSTAKALTRELPDGAVADIRAELEDELADLRRAKSVLLSVARTRPARESARQLQQSLAERTAQVTQLEQQLAASERELEQTRHRLGSVTAKCDALDLVIAELQSAHSNGATDLSSIAQRCSAAMATMSEHVLRFARESAGRLETMHALQEQREQQIFMRLSSYYDSVLVAHTLEPS
eukprot:m.92289 g.92289  ORF g.92289 m.92289 type:complete len:702 (-) comp13772_c2_seq1:22-2127(-)